MNFCPYILRIVEISLKKYITGINMNVFVNFVLTSIVIIMVGNFVCGCTNFKRINTCLFLKVYN